MKICPKTLFLNEQFRGRRSGGGHTDGKQKTQLTDNKLFVRTWVVNKKTGTIVITGHYDTNNNGKYDNTDKNEIGIYDLKTLKLISKL